MTAQGQETQVRPQNKTRPPILPFGVREEKDRSLRQSAGPLWRAFPATRVCVVGKPGLQTQAGAGGGRESLPWCTTAMFNPAPGAGQVLARSLGGSPASPFLFLPVTGQTVKIALVLQLKRK